MWGNMSRVGWTGLPHRGGSDVGWERYDLGAKQGAKFMSPDAASYTHLAAW